MSGEGEEYVDPVSLEFPDDPHLASDGCTYGRETLLSLTPPFASPVTREWLRPLAVRNPLAFMAVGKPIAAAHGHSHLLRLYAPDDVGANANVTWEVTEIKDASLSLALCSSLPAEIVRGGRLTVCWRVLPSGERWHPPPLRALAPARAVAAARGLGLLAPGERNAQAGARCAGAWVHGAPCLLDETLVDARW